MDVKTSGVIYVGYDDKPIIPKLKKKYTDKKSPMTFPATGPRCGGQSCSACKS